MQHFVLERKVPEGDDVEARVEEDEEDPVEEKRQGEKKRCCSCAKGRPQLKKKRFLSGIARIT